MQAIMAQRPQNRTFFGWLNNPYARGDVLDRDFDDDANQRPITAESLDRLRRQLT
jgi:hypothetical protein